ncbi:MAG: phosphomethylpyrimidine synthase ThiC [Euryarchaeota archaeon]|nr:phosphomethylpyrimidine synthase ThiC [Euryarchaeota archaeon]
MSLMADCRKSVPKVVAQAAKAEGIRPEKLARSIASGRAVLPFNEIHSPKPLAIGEGTRVKVNVNIGTSADYVDLKEELGKARAAVKYGADAIMDLSTGGDIGKIRRAILKEVRVPVGTVPIYQAGMEKARRSAVVDMTEDDIFNAIVAHAKDGVDFVTVHCGVTRESVDALKRSKRITDVVSRGGAFLVAWILRNGEENPLYSNYDYLLEIAKEYDLTLSLGDGMRPGCIADATDEPQVQELITLGECVQRARKAGVQAMVEGPGHVPLHQIVANVQLEKTICDEAPFYVLGPLVTDIAPGYDHITGAIGGALAALAGADFLCYVTPAEHLCLPSIDDVRDGTIASVIAAHAADVARGIGADRDMDMARARKALDWEGQFRSAIDPDTARARHERRGSSDGDVCSMCGDLCAIKMVSDALGGGKKPASRPRKR